MAEGENKGHESIYEHSDSSLKRSRRRAVCGKAARTVPRGGRQATAYSARHAEGKCSGTFHGVMINNSLYNDIFRKMIYITHYMR